MGCFLFLMGFNIGLLTILMAPWGTLSSRFTCEMPRGVHKIKEKVVSLIEGMRFIERVEVMWIGGKWCELAEGTCRRRKVSELTNGWGKMEGIWIGVGKCIFSCGMVKGDNDLRGWLTENKVGLWVGKKNLWEDFGMCLWETVTKEWVENEFYPHLKGLTHGAKMGMPQAGWSFMGEERTIKMMCPLKEWIFGI